MTRQLFSGPVRKTFVKVLPPSSRRLFVTRSPDRIIIMSSREAAHRAFFVHYGWWEEWAAAANSSNKCSTFFPLTLLLLGYFQFIYNQYNRMLLLMSPGRPWDRHRGRPTANEAATSSSPFAATRFSDERKTCHDLRCAAPNHTAAAYYVWEGHSTEICIGTHALASLMLKTRWSQVCSSPRRVVRIER